MLFLNSPKSHHYGNSSTTICFFLWLLGRVHILTNCEENPVRAGALLHPVQLSSINTCTAPVPWPVQPKFPSQSCLGLLSGFMRPNAEFCLQLCRAAWWRHWAVSACFSFSLVFGMRWRTHPQRTSCWQCRALCTPSFCSFSLLFPVLFTTCHSHHIFSHWSENLT